MFHEHRDIVTKLKTSNAHFKKIFDEHNNLHDEIEKLKDRGIDDITLETMKKQKLKLKDEAYFMIIKAKSE